jgi:hypothetical protein
MGDWIIQMIATTLISIKRDITFALCFKHRTLLKAVNQSYLGRKPTSEPHYELYRNVSGQPESARDYRAPDEPGE